MLFTMDMKYKGEDALRYSVIVTYFVEGWNRYRGCKIENTCAKEYGIGVIEE